MGSSESKNTNGGFKCLCSLDEMFLADVPKAINMEKKKALQPAVDNSSDDEGDDESSSSSENEDEHDYRYELVKYEQKTNPRKRKMKAHAKTNEFELVKQSTKTLNTMPDEPTSRALLVLGSRSELQNISTAVLASVNQHNQNGRGDVEDGDDDDDDNFFQRPYVDDGEDDDDVDTRTVNMKQMHFATDAATTWSSAGSSVADAAPPPPRDQRARRHKLPMTSLLEDGSMSFKVLNAPNVVTGAEAAPASCAVAAVSPEPHGVHVTNTTATHFAQTATPTSVGSGLSGVSSIPTVHTTPHTTPHTHSSQASMTMATNPYGLTVAAQSASMLPVTSVPFANQYMSLPEPPHPSASSAMSNNHRISRSVDWASASLNNNFTHVPATPTHNIDESNLNEWDIDRIQSQQDAMQKELSFLKEKLQVTRDDNLDSDSSSLDE
mmetsp:Transcript_39128/g.63992  ORF Transcript_39128/g.63992 Transcript_39128/m.63992 type:complete len:437 (+) Transcript_39128:311-1621(+)